MPGPAHIKTVLITGGTGLIGHALTDALIERGFHVIILTRGIKDGISGGSFSKDSRPAETALSVPGKEYAYWDVENQIIDKEAIAKAEHIIHLAGASLSEKRWTKKRKQEIRDSRVKSSELIVKALKENRNKVKTVISASATGWYGEQPYSGNSRNSRKEKIATGFAEEHPAADDFLGNTCRLWEESISPVTKSGQRLVILRTGIVLCNEGGALPEFRNPLRFGLAAILGTGKQVISWIHIDDLVRIFLFALDNETMKGAYNAVAPYPVTNKELTLKIAEVERGRLFIPVHVPAFVLKLVFGELSTEVLKNTRVSASHIQVQGFIFQFPTLDAAIRQLGAS